VLPGAVPGDGHPYGLIKDSSAPEIIAIFTPCPHHKVATTVKEETGKGRRSHFWPHSDPESRHDHHVGGGGFVSRSAPPRTYEIHNPQRTGHPRPKRFISPLDSTVSTSSKPSIVAQADATSEEGEKLCMTIHERRQGSRDKFAGLEEGKLNDAHDTRIKSDLAKSRKLSPEASVKFKNSIQCKFCDERGKDHLALLLAASTAAEREAHLSALSPKSRKVIITLTC